MDIFNDASTVTAILEFTDSNGNLVTPFALNYRVYDEAGTEVVAPTALPQPAPSDVEVDITVADSLNTLDTRTRMIRVIELTVTDTLSANHIVNYTYVIEASKTLAINSNSFQTYESALLNAMDMPGLDMWDAATERERKAALIDSYRSLRVLPFIIPSTSGSQDSLFSSSVSVDLTNLTDAEFAVLDADFLQALKLAQVSEADVRMGGDDVAEKRRNGVMSETIGESSMMFRPGRSLDLSVSKQSLRYLSRYLNRSARIARA